MTHLGKNSLRLIKTVVFFVCLIPIGQLGLGLAQGDLGANPVEVLLLTNGEWALNFLLITLAVSPARRITGWVWLVRLRRMLGLFAFFYVFMHFLVYLTLDLNLDFSNLLEDIIDRPYITIGFLALVLLVPLAVTSTNAMMRRLGKRWKELHKLVYPIAILGVWHFWWQVKSDILEPLIYAAILAVLLGYRLIGRYRPRMARKVTPATVNK